MNPFEPFFEKHCRDVHSDIYLHLPTLREYAAMCDHVTEFGVREGRSTAALMAGAPKHLRAYDIRPLAASYEIFRIAEREGYDYQLFEADVLTSVIEPTDLLFIDTYHCYSQMRLELKLHAERVKRFLVFHDVEAYGLVAEDPLYGGVPDPKGGIMPAIREYREDYPEWSEVYYSKACCGLMVLERDA